MNVHPSLKVKFNNDFKKVNNSEFVAGTALIAYSGDNRNYSDITEQAFTDALPSLGLVPVVGHWLSEKQNFGGHDITIEWSGNQLVLKDNTVPYGVVKENHNAEWIEIEDNGVKHKYLKADVVLWYGRYPEPVQKVIDDGANQSMEINVASYSEKENNYLQIDKFEYSALCLLGKEIDENGNKGNGNVEPCFESASITVDKFSVNEQFKDHFNQLLFALNKETTLPSEGGESIQMTKEMEGETMSEVTQTEQLSFSATYRQKRESLSNALDPIIIRDSNDKIIEETYYWVADFDDEYVYVEKNHWTENNYECDNGRFSYTFDESSLIATITSDFERMILVWLTEEENQRIQEERNNFTVQIESLSSKIAEFESTIATLSEENNTLKSINEELSTYKLNKEKEVHIEVINDVFSRFEEELNENQDYVDYKNSVQENIMDYSAEQVDEKLSAIFGKLQFSKTNKKPKEKVSATVIETNSEEIRPSRYGSLERFVKKD